MLVNVQSKLQSKLQWVAFGALSVNSWGSWVGTRFRGGSGVVQVCRIWFPLSHWALSSPLGPLHSSLPRPVPLSLGLGASPTWGAGALGQAPSLTP